MPADTIPVTEPPDLLTLFIGAMYADTQGREEVERTAAQWREKYGETKPR